MVIERANERGKTRRAPSYAKESNKVQLLITRDCVYVVRKLPLSFTLNNTAYVTLTLCSVAKEEFDMLRV